MKKMTMILCIMLIILAGAVGCPIKAQEVKSKEALNEIRFKGWQANDWLDNEYIRTLRKYVDSYNRGKIKDASLDTYKDNIKGQFVIANIRPFMAGGVFISIIFLDMPNRIFEAWVYSKVDTQKETISDYEVYSIKIAKEETSFTKEDILHIIKEHPENKLW